MKAQIWLTDCTETWFALMLAKWVRNILWILFINGVIHVLGVSVSKHLIGWANRTSRVLFHVRYASCVSWCRLFTLPNFNPDTMFSHVLRFDLVGDILEEFSLIGWSMIIVGEFWFPISWGGVITRFLAFMLKNESLVVLQKVPICFGEQSLKRNIEHHWPLNVTDDIKLFCDSAWSFSEKLFFLLVFAE